MMSLSSVVTLLPWPRNEHGWNVMRQVPDLSSLAGVEDGNCEFLILDNIVNCYEETGKFSEEFTWSQIPPPWIQL